MYGTRILQACFAIACFYFLLLPLYVYIADKRRLRRFPSVSIAGFTDVWAVLQQAAHNRTYAIHEGHRRLGPIVRVGTNHVSFSSTQAIKDIYGHGSPVTKAPFYNAFVSTHFNISDAQIKSIHSEKRRRFASALAQKSIVQLENVIEVHMNRLLDVLDSKADAQAHEVDMKRIMMYFMFDFISNCMYAVDPKCLERDSAVVTAETPDGKLYKTDMYYAAVDSAHLSIAGGWAQGSLLQIWKFITRGHHSWASGTKVRDTTLHFLRNRLRMDEELVSKGLPPIDDLLTLMLFDRNGQPLKLETGELISEAANMFNAGGENTEISATNIIWHLAKTPRAIAKLREELDAAWDRNKDPIPAYEQVQDLPYLRACVDEGMRLGPAIDMGLPRITPPQGMYVDGHWLEGDTVVSVSTHTIHRDPAVFNDDPENFAPERWLGSDANKMQRGFLAFSQGSRACIGRNIAYFEMLLVVAFIFSRYDLEPMSDNFEPETGENFSMHVISLPLKIKKREV